MSRLGLDLTAARRLAPSRDRLATASGDPVVTAFVAVLVGYLVLGRAFAQIGVGGLFVGEALLAAAIIHPGPRAALRRFLAQLDRPGHLHVLAWATAVFVGYGVVQLAIGLRSGHPPLEALKTSVFSGYAIFLPVGIWLGRARPDLLVWLARYLPWVNGIYVVGVELVFRPLRSISLPLSAIPGLTPGHGTVLSILLIFAFRDKLGMRPGLLTLNVLALLVLQVRGDWLAVGVALLVWGLLTRRTRVVVGFGLLGIAALLLVATLGITIPGAEARGGAVSLDEVAARSIAPFDPALAAELSPAAARYSGTAQWRTQWWDAIWTDNQVSQGHLLFGNGHGFDLAGLADHVDEGIRTPHSAFFFALGYTGWIGVLVFWTFHAALASVLIRSARRTGQPLGVMIWIGALAAGHFGNYFETPFGGIPFFLLMGVTLAADPEIRLEAPTTGERSAST